MLPAAGGKCRNCRHLPQGGAAVVSLEEQAARAALKAENQVAVGLAVAQVHNPRMVAGGAIGIHPGFDREITSQAEGRQHGMVVDAVEAE